MPHVLADQDRGPADSGPERPDPPALRQIPLLIEDPVGREIDLAVDMDDLAQREIDGGVIEEALGRLLVKPYDEINPTTQVSQSPEEGTGEGQGARRNDILEEVSGQAKLGEDKRAGR